MAAGTYQIIAAWNDGQMQKAVKIVKTVVIHSETDAKELSQIL